MKTAVVTGSYQGIGKGIADLLSQNGYTVVYSDVHEHMDGVAHYCKCNIADAADRNALLAYVDGNFGRLDLLVKEAKGRAMKVAVSGAFHSPFMADAERGLAAYLADGHAPAEPSVPVLANRTGEAYPADEAGRIELLSSQVANPVQWVRTLQNMAADGVDTFIEVGPGKTLTGLVSRTLEGVTALPCETAEQLEAVLATLPKRGE